MIPPKEHHKTRLHSYWAGGGLPAGFISPPDEPPPPPPPPSSLEEYPRDWSWLALALIPIAAGIVMAVVVLCVAIL